MRDGNSFDNSKTAVSRVKTMDGPPIAVGEGPRDEKSRHTHN